MKVKLGKHTFTITKADGRDFKLMMFGGALNVFFGMEKYFIVYWKPLPDRFWMIVYLGMGFLIWGYALYDFVRDEIEEEKHETNFML